MKAESCIVYKRELKIGSASILKPVRRASFKVDSNHLLEPMDKWMKEVISWRDWCLIVPDLKALKALLVFLIKELKIHLIVAFSLAFYYSSMNTDSGTPRQFNNMMICLLKYPWLKVAHLTMFKPMSSQSNLIWLSLSITIFPTRDGFTIKTPLAPPILIWKAEHFLRS